jgi:hypothetical protein
MIKYKNPSTGLWEILPFLIDGSGLPAITPEMFGAKGDGVTDDSEAIRTAILNCKTGGTLYFSNNTYAVSQTISIDKKINIDGRTCTIIPMDGFNPDNSVFTFTNQTAGFGTKVSGVLVNCQNRAKHGFRVTGRGSTQITFSECSVSGAMSDGFIIEPMAYCMFFKNCISMSNGGSGISVVATDSDHQVNAITVDGCSLLMNRKHGVHVSGVHIVVENCIIELNGVYSVTEGNVVKYYYVDATEVEDPKTGEIKIVAVGSGVYVGVPGYPSQNIVIQNNYFEPSADAQVTVSSSYASVRVLNNYFLSETGKQPSGHTVTHVKCVHSGDATSAVNLRYQNNTVAGSTRTDVDGGNILDQFSVVDAEVVQNAKTTNLTRPAFQGVRHFIPLSLSSGTPHEKGIDNKSVNLVTDDVKKIAIVLPFTLYNSVFRYVGFNVIVDGTSATIKNRIHVKDANGMQLKGTFFDYKMNAGVVEGRESEIVGNSVGDLWNYNCWGNLLNNFGYYNIPNNSYVEVTLELISAGDAKSVVISNPFIDIYNP